MRKTLTVLATIAEARWGGGWGGGWHGGWRGPGLVGGLIAGGLIAGALAPRYYGYGYPGYYGYYDGPYCWRRHFNGWRWVAYRVC
jgi:hypothetical protein